MIKIVQVFDLKGKLIQAQITDATSQPQLDVHLFAQGTYILRVKDESGKTVTAKWIKDGDE